ARSARVRDARRTAAAPAAHGPRPLPRAGAPKAHRPPGTTRRTRQAASPATPGMTLRPAQHCSRPRRYPRSRYRASLVWPVFVWPVFVWLVLVWLVLVWMVLVWSVTVAATATQLRRERV